MRRYAIVLGMAVTCMGAAGCESSGTAQTGDNAQAHDYWYRGDQGVRTKTASKPMEPARPAERPMVMPASGMASMAFPTGDRSTSAILLERSMPAEVMVGQPFDYEIRVTNLTRMTLKEVAVRDQCAGNFNLVSSNPAAQGKPPADLMWNLGDLGPGEAKVIKVNGKATGTGSVTSCATVTYNSLLCQTANVVQPALKLAISAPAEALICDAINVKLTVTNTGSGVARNAKVTYGLPSGWTTTDGKSSVVLDAGTLVAGQSRDFNVSAKSSKPGAFASKGSAAAEGGLTAESTEAATAVRQPVLAITIAGPDRVYAGRPVTYDISVTNNGDAAAANTVVESTIPAGATFSKATDNGQATTGKVMWNVGTLAPKASKKVSMTVQPTTMGEAKASATAQGVCATLVSATAGTQVAGISALLLEGIDDPDPIEIGGTVTYTITVTNQGTAVDSNIKMVSYLAEDDSMEYVSSSGSTAGTLAGKTLTFATVPSLAPKQKVSWKIVVKAAKPGDVRFRTEVTSDQVKSPAVKIEPTHFYK